MLDKVFDIGWESFVMRFDIVFQNEPAQRSRRLVFGRQFGQDEREIIVKVRK